MNKLVLRILMKASAALFALGIATFLGKKTTEDAEEYKNSKKDSNGK